MLAIGDKEYEEHPPGDDYRDGFNLLCRLHDKEHTLLFLRNPDVDTSNNCCERALRVIKRMLATMGTFRGDDPFSIDMYCAALSVFMSYIHGDDEVLGGLEQIFSIEAVDPRTTRRREKKQKAGTPGAAQSKPAEASGDSQEPESDAASASCSA